MSEKNKCSTSPPREFTFDEEFIKLRANFFKVLADPVRLQIIDLLQEGPLCVCEIEPYFNKSQAAISKHLKVLVNANLLDLKAEGTKNIYFLKNKHIFQVLKSADEILAQNLEIRAQKIKNLRLQAKKTQK